MAVHGAMISSLPRASHRAGTCPDSGGSTIRSRWRSGFRRIRASTRRSRPGSLPRRACAGGSPGPAVRSCRSRGCVLIMASSSDSSMASSNCMIPRTQPRASFRSRFSCSATENRTRYGPCSLPGSPHHKVRRISIFIAVLFFE